MLSRQSTTCLDVFRCLKLAVSRLVPFGVWSLNRFVTRPFLHFSRLIVEGRTSLWGQTSGFLFRLAQCSQVTLQPYHWNLLCRKMLVNKNRFEILDRVLNDSLLHSGLPPKLLAGVRHGELHFLSASVICVAALGSDGVPAYQCPSSQGRWRARQSQS